MDSRTTWPALIGALIKGEHLAADETAWAMNEIMDGAATPAQIAGFGVALRIKGETAGEVTGLAQAMLDHASPISIPGVTVDLVGTGGDGARTVNISTMGTIAAAAAGARMVKHGNRAASSACGTADVLEALGVVIDLPPPATEQLVAEIGAGVLVRAAVSPGAAARDRPAARARRADCLQRPRPGGQPGPACCAGAGRGRPADGPDPGWRAGRPRLLGAGVPRRRRPGRADHDGAVRGLDRARRHRQRDCLRPGRARDRPVGAADLLGGDPAHNAGVAREFLAGDRARCAKRRCSTPGRRWPPRPASPGPDALAAALADGYRRAAAAVDSGAAAGLLDRWVTASKQLAANT